MVWLASYPKSGNTWFRVFLSNLLEERDEPAHINQLKQTPIVSSRTIFDQLVGIPSSDLTPDMVHRIQPEVFKLLSEQNPEVQFYKVHDANFPLPDGEPFIPPEITRGVVYFIRNPLDVCVSFAHHLARNVDEAVRVLNDDDFGFCMKTNVLHHQLRQRVYSWSSHVKSWLDAGLPVHVMRYEDMQADPYQSFSQALQFLGLEYPSERIEKAIKFSTFTRLKEQEEKDGFKEKNRKAESFFRKGEVNDWKNRLSEQQVEIIVKKHKEVMKEYGYIDWNRLE